MAHISALALSFLLLLTVSTAAQSPASPAAADQVGSEPPSCQNKCKGCTPCVRVHVPVPPPPASDVPLPDDPQEWKCKCGSTLYNPGPPGSN